MVANPRSANRAVSIVTCTNRPYCIHKLFGNYRRQNYKNKELIVILNNNAMKMRDYIAASKNCKNVRIYRQPEHLSLGQCLNYGVRLSKYGTIAKFDDDDYYAANYLNESMRILRKTKADIVGKRAHFMYLAGRKRLLLRYRKKENKYVSLVQGATLVVKRCVFKRVSFPNQTRRECVKFCFRCIARGFKIYSGNKYNFAAVRRKNSKDHTWIVSDKRLLKQNVKVFKVKRFKTFVSR